MGTSDTLKNLSRDKARDEILTKLAITLDGLVRNCSQLLNRLFTYVWKWWSFGNKFHGAVRSADFDVRLVHFLRRPPSTKLHSNFLMWFRDDNKKQNFDSNNNNKKTRSISPSASKGCRSTTLQVDSWYWGFGGRRKSLNFSHSMGIKSTLYWYI